MNKFLMFFLGLSSFFIMFNQSAFAQTTARPCPYNCASAGIPKHMCQDWAQGNVCFVKKLNSSQGNFNPGFNNQQITYNGDTSYGPCPHTCRTAGNTCYVKRVTRNFNNVGVSQPSVHSNINNNIAGVRSGPCPFSCANIGVPKSRCKDWRNGNVCYVQAF
jgi:hypothetical protein